MPNPFDTFFLSTSLEIDRIRNDLFKYDVAILRSPKERDSLAIVISGTYVWLAALIENYTKLCLEGIISEINSSNTPHNKIIHSLFAMTCSPELFSLQNVRGLKMWNQRVDIIEKMSTTNQASILVEHIPLDGKTIRPDHLEAIWRVFNFPGNYIPSPRHRLALNDIADGRNLVAHGEIDPIKFGRQKSILDVKKLVDYSEDIILNMQLSIDDYINNKMYII